MRTVRSNKGLKLTRPVEIGASQLNPRVLRTIRGDPSSPDDGDCAYDSR